MTVAYNYNEGYLFSLGLLDYDWFDADAVTMRMVVKDENGLESTFTFSDIIVETSQWKTYLLESSNTDFIYWVPYFIEDYLYYLEYAFFKTNPELFNELEQKNQKI